MRTFLIAVCFSSAIFAMSGSLEATSPQIEWSEPSFVLNGAMSSAVAFFGIISGSSLYDTAGSLGATFQKKMAKEGSYYFFADIFTWIENKGTEFMPRRVIYTIEPGYTTLRGNARWRAFIKHQSFHDVDSFDNLNEAYELYGLSFQQLSEPMWYISVGKYLNRRIVDYRWDLATSVTREIGSLKKNRIYGHVWLHYVSEHQGNILHRNDFTDYALETSVDFQNGLVGFLRYELLHDIERFAGTADNHLILGARFKK
ncbi:MAG: hypothetical protein K6T99_09510 [Armatimonadetes bacterium]|nr:hypothetical protein [Armatimonadota bacterium]